tara:strand:- start:796 stop:1341 length:546 start_codon:yes stop_codon:yes gene_type:complete
MSNLIKLPKQKEEEIEEEPKEEEPIFKEETNEDLNIEPIIEPVEPVEEKKTKPKRTRNMSEAAKKQLDDARRKSIETRKRNAELKRKEKEEKELTNKKYIDEIGYLKQQIEELKNKQPQEKIVEKVVYKEKEVKEEDSYKFSLNDLDYYATEYLKKHKEAEEQLKSKRNQDIRNKYFLNMR